MKLEFIPRACDPHRTRQHDSLIVHTGPPCHSKKQKQVG
jgi:hypothetical protein